MRSGIVVLAALVAAFFANAPSYPQAQPDAQKEKPGPDATKPGPGHDAHSAMNARGESAKGMGFSQNSTVHHFLLKPDGGVIQVEVKDSSDTANRDILRAHLTHTAREFSRGNFALPMFVHDSIPPGTAAMKRLRKKIVYAYEESSNGARVVIKTADPAALDAIHDFLRYQIREHQTGDPETIN